MAIQKTPAASAAAAPAAELPASTLTDDEEFSAAFAEATADTLPAAGATGAAAETPPAKEPPVAGATGAAAEAPSAEEPLAAGATGATSAAVETPPAAEESPEAKIARLEAENAALKQPKPKDAPAAETPPSKDAPAAETSPASPAQPAEIQWYKPTDEEAAIIAKYEADWQDISAAEAIRTKQAVYNAVQYVFAKIAEHYNPQLQRFAELSEVITDQLTLGALRSEHEDYDEVHDKVVAWVETLPGAFKRGAQEVLKSGSPEEVAELITTYKEQHPAAAAPAAAAPAAAPAVAKPRTTELSAAAKKAATALTVVGSKRSAPATVADANDFDAAWQEANAVNS